MPLSRSERIRAVRISTYWKSLVRKSQDVLNKNRRLGFLGPEPMDIRHLSDILLFWNQKTRNAVGAQKRPLRPGRPGTGSNHQLLSLRGSGVSQYFVPDLSAQNIGKHKQLYSLNAPLFVSPESVQSIHKQTFLLYFQLFIANNTQLKFSVLAIYQALRCMFHMLYFIQSTP